MLNALSEKYFQMKKIKFKKRKIFVFACVCVCVCVWWTVNVYKKKISET